MKITGNNNGYYMSLTAADTARWSRRAGHSWPGSRAAHKTIKVSVDNNGLCDCNKNAESVPGEELCALVGDHLTESFRHLWPVWGQTDKFNFVS